MKAKTKQPNPKGRMLCGHTVPIKNYGLFGDNLWHGAIYINGATPSGFERLRLTYSDPVGHENPEEAIIRVNAAVDRDIIELWAPKKGAKKK